MTVIGAKIIGTALVAHIFDAGKPDENHLFIN